jgi:hypothetical protein
MHRGLLIFIARRFDLSFPQSDETVDLLFSRALSTVGNQEIKMDGVAPVEADALFPV